VAFKIVKKEFPDAELFIVGRMPDLSNYVDCNGKGVHCLGYVEDLGMVIRIQRFMCIWVAVRHFQ